MTTQASHNMKIWIAFSYVPPPYRLSNGDGPKRGQAMRDVDRGPAPLAWWNKVEMNAVFSSSSHQQIKTTHRTHYSPHPKVTIKTRDIEERHSNAQVMTSLCYAINEPPIWSQWIWLQIWVATRPQPKQKDTQNYFFFI